MKLGPLFTQTGSGYSDGGGDCCRSSENHQKSSQSCQTRDLKKESGKYTCSQEEEQYVQMEALKWTTEFQEYDYTIICSDIQPLLTSIDSLNPDSQDVMKFPDTLLGKIPAVDTRVQPKLISKTKTPRPQHHITIQSPKHTTVIIRKLRIER